MRYPSVNRFRTKRGKVLRAQIEALADQLGRDVVILDIGGRPDYWVNVGLDRIERIELLNLDASEFKFSYPDEIRSDFFQNRIGDARDLSDYPDQSVDLIHANSVIEHVGDWGSMQAMASEMARVGRSGWMQTPAWEFPLEPHFRTLFGHWFGKPVQVWSMSFSFAGHSRRLRREHRRLAVDRINLLSKGEVRALFPEAEMIRERIVLVKSYVMRWMPSTELETAPAITPADTPAVEAVSDIDPGTQGPRRAGDRKAA